MLQIKKSSKSKNVRFEVDNRGVTYSNKNKLPVRIDSDPGQEVVGPDSFQDQYYPDSVSK